MHEWWVATDLIKASLPRGILATTWEPLPPNIPKPNVDGSFNPQTNTSGIGGVLRDHQGPLIQAFATTAHANSTLEAKLQAIPRGAKMCLDLSLIEVIIEGDSFIIWNNINCDSGMPWRLMNLWKNLRRTLAQISSMAGPPHPTNHQQAG